MNADRLNRALDNVDANLRMFRGYRESDWNRNMIKTLEADRAELVELIAGDREYASLSYTNKERFFDMPAWGTYGT